MLRVIEIPIAANVPWRTTLCYIPEALCGGIGLSDLCGDKTGMAKRWNSFSGLFTDPPSSFCAILSYPGLAPPRYTGTVILFMINAF